MKRKNRKNGAVIVLDRKPEEEEAAVLDSEPENVEEDMVVKDFGLSPADLADEKALGTLPEEPKSKLKERDVVIQSKDLDVPKEK